MLLFHIVEYRRWFLVWEKWWCRQRQWHDARFGWIATKYWHQEKSAVGERKATTSGTWKCKSM